MKYIATQTVSFPAGTELGLSKVQAAARAHAVTPLADRKGWYQLTAGTQFKAGEQFGYDGDIPKGMADALEPAKRGPSKLEQIEAARQAVAAAEAACQQAGTQEAAAAAEAKLADAKAALAALEG